MMDTFKLEICETTLLTSDEDWNEVYLNQVRAAGFDLVGGIFVSFLLTAEDNPNFGAAGTATVARRCDPVARPPESGHESTLPEFMEFRAFLSDDQKWKWDSWSILLINTLISANNGKLPEGWLGATGR